MTDEKNVVNVTRTTKPLRGVRKIGDMNSSILRARRKALSKEPNAVGKHCTLKNKVDVKVSNLPQHGVHQ